MMINKKGLKKKESKMKNADEYLLNKALGKELNSKNWRISEVPVQHGTPRQWKFPDGSKITETERGNGELIGLEEIK